MSSLKATQSDGYYIPPDYLNSGAYKKKSLNQYNQSKGHNQYLKNNVVRFEIPYDGFCLRKSCGCHVAKGTRYNAQKEQVGTYFSSKIWEFRMTCRECSNPFAIRTNPKERCFDYVSGIKKKIEEFDTTEAKSLGVIDTEYGHAIHNFTNGRLDVPTGSQQSAIERLEKEVLGQRRVISDLDAMKMLLQHNRSTMHDDATSNSNLRATYRTVRKRKKQGLSEAKSRGLGKGIVLDEVQHDDLVESRRAFERNNVQDRRARLLEKRKFQELQKGIFSHRGGLGKTLKQKEDNESKAPFQTIKKDCYSHDDCCIDESFTSEHEAKRPSKTKDEKLQYDSTNTESKMSINEFKIGNSSLNFLLNYDSDSSGS